MPHVALNATTLFQLLLCILLATGLVLRFR